MAFKKFAVEITAPAVSEREPRKDTTAQSAVEEFAEKLLRLVQAKLGELSIRVDKLEAREKPEAKSKSHCESVVPPAEPPDHVSPASQPAELVLRLSRVSRSRSDSSTYRPSQGSLGTPPS